MEYIEKIYNYRKCSHNKFNKAQLADLRSGRYFLFERSYAECMKRLMFMDAILHSGFYKHDENKAIYRRKSIRNFREKIRDTFLFELKSLGYLNNDANIYMLALKEFKNIKITIEK